MNVRQLPGAAISSLNGGLWARTRPAPCGNKEPSWSDFSAFSEAERVFDVHAQIAYGVLDLRVTQQDLHGTEVARRFVDDGRFGSAERMRAVLLPTKAHADHPLVDKPGVLPRAE